MLHELIDRQMFFRSGFKSEVLSAITEIECSGFFKYELRVLIEVYSHLHIKM